MFSISVENSLSDISAIYAIDPNTEKPFMLVFLNDMVPFIHKIIDHIPVWATVPLFFINLHASFVWNYVDIFIMVISMGLSELFKQLNSELEQVRIKVNTVKTKTFFTFTVLNFCFVIDYDF